jgi:hypothetical protein
VAFTYTLFSFIHFSISSTASSPDYENYDCLIVADDEPSDQIESSSDFEAANLTAVTLSNGCQAFVSANELNLDQGRQSSKISLCNFYVYICGQLSSIIYFRLRW